MVTALLLSNFFPFQKLSETQKVSPTKFFGTVRQKNSDGNSWYPPIKQFLFTLRNFLKNWKVPLGNFSVLWDKKISPEYRGNCPSFIHFFSFPEVIWNTEGFRDEVFWYCETKGFDGKALYPPIMHNLFPCPNFFEKSRVPTRRFSKLEFFDGKSRYPPTMHNVFWIPQAFWHLKGFAEDVFGALREKKFRRNNVIPLPLSLFIPF